MTAARAQPGRGGEEAFTGARWCCLARLQTLAQHRRPTAATGGKQQGARGTAVQRQQYRPLQAATASPVCPPARLQLLMPRPGRRWKHLKQKQRWQEAQPSRWYSSERHHTQRGTRLTPAGGKRGEQAGSSARRMKDAGKGPPTMAGCADCGRRQAGRWQACGCLALMQAIHTQVQQAGRPTAQAYRGQQVGRARCRPDTGWSLLQRHVLALGARVRTAAAPACAAPAAVPLAAGPPASCRAG